MTAREDYRGTFRIDDVSVNTDRHALWGILTAIWSRMPSARALLAVSPMVHDMGGEPERERGRIFPKILNAHSDPRVFYRVDRVGIPDFGRFLDTASQRPFMLDLASHGLLHVDHRLLPYAAQEVSIITSCSLVKSKVFVPPFNHWNRDTEAICAEHGITLVKWEDGWRHAGHNGFDPGCPLYYLHEHDTTAADIAAWLDR